MEEQSYTVVEVHSITNTDEQGALIFDVTLTNPKGDTERFPMYVFRTSDPYGASPVLWQFLLDNPEFPLQPYVPTPEPTAEELRARMRPLSSRQIRLGLISAGISLATVDATLASMPEGQEKEAAQVEWEYATTFNRTHVLIGLVGGALGLTDEQIDAMWATSLLL